MSEETKRHIWEIRCCKLCGVKFRTKILLAIRGSLEAVAGEPLPWSGETKCIACRYADRAHAHRLAALAFDVKARKAREKQKRYA